MEIFPQETTNYYEVRYGHIRKVDLFSLLSNPIVKDEVPLKQLLPSEIFIIIIFRLPYGWSEVH